MQRLRIQPKPQFDLLPDFCRARPLLTVAFVMEMVAVVMTLSGGPLHRDMVVGFVLLSLYLQWIGFFSAAVLCVARRWLRVAPAGRVFGIAWGLLLVVTLVVSWTGFELERYLSWDPPAIKASRVEFVLVNLCVSAIVSLFLLRYFWVQNQWRAQVSAEADARYQALQARIRPHFLFNSLNSIAALVSTRPDDAEQLIEDLSELFRVSLDVRSRLVPLADEIDVVKAYLRIEQVRLGERLQIEWDIPETLLAIEVPLLCVQPLAENAVYHGIAQLKAGGTVTLRARAEPGFVVLEVENPLPEGVADQPKGLQMALDNIAQRLALIYGERASLSLGEDVGRFRASLRMPVTVESK